MNDVGTGRRPDWRFLMQHPAHFLALGFGAGLSPKAPGTAGTVAAVPVYWLLLQAPGGWLTYSLALAAIVGIGIWACGVTERALGTHDHGSIVWDEIAGYLLTMWFIPFDWRWMIAGFALFRLFDIWKPFPVSWADQRMTGGLGTMVDDLLAGVYAAIALNVLVILVIAII